MSFLKAFFASLLAICFVILLLLAGLGGMAAGKKPQVPKHATLVLTLDGGLADYPAGGGAPWEKGELTLYDARKTLQMAAVDKRIERVVLDISGAGGRFASLDEMRSWIAGVRAKGKPVYAFVQNLTPTSLYLAAACDSVWMPVEGQVVFTGFDQQRPFLASMMQKLGVQVKQHQIKEYKSAAEMTVRTDLSEPARRNAQWLLDPEIAAWRRVLRDERKMSDADIDTALVRAMMLPEEALPLHMIDGIVWWDDLVARWDDPKAALPKGKSRFVDAMKYARVDPASVGLKGKKKIGIVHAQGMIGGRESGRGPMGEMMGWASVTDDLRRMREDKDIVAVVFRVDSPGGSSYTSEVIARAVAELQKKKPVVVSMGAVAASGGYKISYPCTTMVANELTITGSIGSITTYFNPKGLWDKLGITWDGISYGPRHDLLTGLRDWTPEERALVEKNHWDGYNLWVRDIARVRGLDFATLDSTLGRGRVWTGRQAMEHGLVDSLGTLDDAIRIAARMAGVKAGDKVTEVHLPRKKSFTEALQSGDFALAWEALGDEVAASLWHRAAAPVTQTWDTMRALGRERSLDLDPDLVELP